MDIGISQFLEEVCREHDILDRLYMGWLQSMDPGIDR